MSFGDCPICLEEFQEADVLFKLPCCTCGYNFCVNCLDDFIKSSKDDFQEASDGSRQVKIQLNCPQCRSDYPMDIAEVAALRNAHTLAESLMEQKTGLKRQDSDLSATQLAKKRDFQSYGNRKNIQGAFALYKKVLKDGNMELPESLNVSRLSALDVLLEGDSKKDGQSCIDAERADTIDESLFQGLGDCMGKDEKLFLTQLLTSGKSEKLAQAAMIMNGILKLSMSGHTMAASTSALNPSDHVKLAEQIAKVKKQFPTANHMPGYFMIPLFDRSQKHLKLMDAQWDGTIVPPAQSIRVFDAIYGNYYRPKTLSRPVVQVKSVRGPVGRLGLRRGDVVTHVNDMEWKGNASELSDYLQQSYIKHPNDEMSLTVNANEETAEFLKIRSAMLYQSSNIRI